ncbi:hypothetical protein A3K69_02100 [Candidatus Bathyarchaeota archaeon RBG_16_57_9]|nr:MAG: hypothetical protein A3K69_02100 [Candidatus Bathyarchaeota archaeon RBG_16_57_9]
MSIRIIAKTLGTDDDWGTIPGNVEFVNNLLGKSRPKIQFQRQISGRYTEITTEIDAERPIIAWIDPQKIVNDEVWHVVMINGYDPNQRKIFFVDPLLKKEEYWQKEAESSHFVEERLGSKGMLIKLIIDGGGQQTLINLGEE